VGVLQSFTSIQLNQWPIFMLDGLGTNSKLKLLCGTLWYYHTRVDEITFML